MCVQLCDKERLRSNASNSVRKPVLCLISVSRVAEAAAGLTLGVLGAGSSPAPLTWPVSNPKTFASPEGRDVAQAEESAQEQPLAHGPQALLLLLPGGLCPSHTGLCTGLGSQLLPCASSQVTPG